MTPKQQRKSIGMSVTQFAAALDTTPHTVRRWEMNQDKKGARQPGKAMAWRIERLVQDALAEIEAAHDQKQGKRQGC